VGDPTPGLGPLAGIASALEAANEAAVLVVAWDMPFVTAPLLRELRRRGEAGAGAVVPVHGAAGVAEPLCAWYGATALASCRALLAGGVRRAGSLLDALPNVVRMGEADLAAFGIPARLFTSVDTAQQLAALGGTIEQQPG
jgi:molybdopterin-guanine dinucleotide biosynthesis protein A